LASRYDRRAILTMALIATAAINLVAALTPGFGSLVGLRVAAALAAAFINPIASATAVMLSAPERRGRALALVTAGLTVAFTLGIPFGSVIGGQFGWRATFVFAGLLALLAALVVRTQLPAVPAPPPAKRSLGALFGERRILSSFALTFLGFAATFTVVAYLGPVVNRATGLSGAAVGPFQACIGIGSIIGVVIGGRIADAHHLRGAVAALFAVMAATLAAYTPLLSEPGQAAILLGVVILLGAAALFTLIPIIQTRLARAAPAAGPVLFGLNGTMIFAGQGAGALLGGLVAETTGFAMIGIAGALVAALGLAVGLATIRPEPAAAQKEATP
jgi:DHA1 family inner membrane transport protein